MEIVAEDSPPTLIEELNVGGIQTKLFERLGLDQEPEVWIDEDMVEFKYFVGYPQLDGSVPVVVSREAGGKVSWYIGILDEAEVDLDWPIRQLRDVIDNEATEVDHAVDIPPRLRGYFDYDHAANLARADIEPTFKPEENDFDEHEVTYGDIES